MTLLFAHRGSHGPGGPLENTVAAFEAAVADGADFIETDLWATRDGRIFIFHDDTFARATEGRERRSVPEMTAAEVRDVRLAGGERVPSLEDLLDTVGGRIPLNLELKHAAALPATLAAVRARRLADQVLLSSFQFDALEAARADAPEIPRGVIMGLETMDLRVRLREAFPFWVLRRCGASYWHPHHLLVNRPLVEALHRLGVALNVWTVNDVSTARRLASLGVDGLFTDHPGALRRELST
jgi:glycerophosphoryl diester phosphodiesterase